VRFLHHPFQAFEYVSPAFYAMIASTLPVGVTLLSIVRGIEPFRLSTLVAAVFVSIGGVMIKAGEVSLSPFGFVLTVTGLLMDVVRLVLVQYLVQPLKLSGPGLMLLSSPLQCGMSAVGGALFEARAIARSVEAGNFTLLAWVVLLLNGSLAMIVNLVTFLFVKVASAVVVAITTPFKDLSIVLMSDNLVVRRQETPMSVAGFSLACGTSLLYNVHNIFRKERERADAAAGVPLIPARAEKTPGIVMRGGRKEVRAEGAKEEAEEEAEARDASHWRFGDARDAALTWCAVAVLLLSTSILAEVDFAKVADAYDHMSHKRVVE
jgi:hypothetical protein